MNYIFVMFYFIVCMMHDRIKRIVTLCLITQDENKSFANKY